MSEKLVCGDKKHAGGKMVRVCVVIGEKGVLDAFVTGDFFVEPDEAYEKLEEELRRVLVKTSDPERLREALSRALESSNAKLHGVEVEDFIEAAKRALEAGS